MRKECNPSHHKGNRNLFCSNYNDCLDHAIAHSWNSWNCRKCKFRFDHADEAQRLTIHREEIVEHALMIQPLNLEWGLPDYDFNYDSDVAG
jgi:hypothetical protein